MTRATTRHHLVPGSLRRSARCDHDGPEPENLLVFLVLLQDGAALSANMSETVTPWKFSVEGEAGSESDERIGTSPRWAGDRGGGKGDAAAVHGGIQAEDCPRGRRL